MAFVCDRWCNRNRSRDDPLWVHPPGRRYVLRDGIETRTCTNHVWYCGQRSHSTLEQCPCNMACHHRHLRHGPLNKRRHVSSGLTTRSIDRTFSLTQFEPLTVPWLWMFYQLVCSPPGTRGQPPCLALAAFPVSSCLFRSILSPSCLPKTESQGEYRPSASLPLVRRDTARDPGHLQHISRSVYPCYDRLVRQGGAFR